MTMKSTATAMEQAARLALDAYPFGSDAALEFVTYRENCVFRVTDSRGSYALRVHRPGYRTDAELRSEAVFLLGLCEQGIPVARIVPNLEGECITSVVTADGHRFAIDVQEWLENTGPLGDIESGFNGTSPLQPTDFRQIGVLTAQLHNASNRVELPADYERKTWDAEGIFGATAVLGDPFALPGIADDDYALLHDASSQVRHVLESIGTNAAVYGPIHADITPENLLQTPQGLVLVDFDDLGDGWHLFDIATALLFYYPHPRFPEFLAATLDGYTSVRPVPGDVWIHFDAFLFARGLTYLGWAATRTDAALVGFVHDDLLPLILELARGLSRNTTTT